MAYLSRDKITGHVIFNICARENDVVNSIRESDINIHPVIRGVDRISSSGSISKYCMDTGFISIKPRDYKAFTEIFNSKIDYTLSCWIYTEDSNRTDLFFNKLSDNRSTIMFGKSIRGGGEESVLEIIRIYAYIMIQVEMTRYIMARLKIVLE